MMFQYLYSLADHDWLPSAIEIIGKSSVVLVIALIVCWLLRNRSAALRHSVWTFALGACVVVPIIVMTGLQVGIPLLSDRVVISQTAVSAEATTKPAFLPAKSGGVETNSMREVVDSALSPVSEPNNSSRAVAETAVVQETIVAHELSVSLGSAIFAIWLVGFTLSLIPLISAVVLQRRRLAAMREIDQSDWISTVAVISKQVGLRRAVTTLQSASDSVPMTCGVFRSVVVVPADWSTWTEAHRQCVLSHELAHVKRRDVAIQLFARLIAAVHWFNPLIWHAVFRLRVEREFACDDEVLFSGRLPSEYADSLLVILRNYRRSRFELGVAMADATRLDQRVEAILGTRRQRRPLSRKATFLFFVPAVCAMGLIGSLALTAAAEIELSETILIHGTVVGPDRQPIASAEIYVNVSERSNSIKLGESNQDGTFRFDVPRERLTRLVSAGIALGQCKASLLAVAKDSGAAWEFLPSANGGRYGDMKSDYRVRLQMVEDLPIKGRIVDEVGAPVGEAVVSVVNAHELDGYYGRKLRPVMESLDVESIKQKEINPNRWFSYQYPGALGVVQATTDESGNYTLTGAGGNRAIRLQASGPGIATPPSFAVISREDASVFAERVREKYPAKGRGAGVRLFGIRPTIAVKRARTIAGTVRDAVTGEPVDDAEVYILGGTPERTSRLPRVRTNANGYYRIIRTDQQTKITVAVDGDDHLYLPLSRTFTDVGQIGETSADFDLPHGTLIRGKVVEANTDRPIASAPRNFCDDIQPGPMFAGYAYYYPLEGNEWLSDLGQGLPSNPFEWAQRNHQRRVYIDQQGEFQIAVPPGKGVVLIEARPPQADLMAAFIPKVPYLTVSGEVTRQLFYPKKPSVKTFPGLHKSIEADDLHAYKMIDLTSNDEQLDLRFDVHLAPSQSIRFVDPDGNPISGLTVAGLAPSTQFKDRPYVGVLEVKDSKTLLFSDSIGNQSTIVAITKDGRFGVTKAITVKGGLPITLQMQPTASLTFRLTDPTTRAPLAGYEVSLTYGNDKAGRFQMKIKPQEAFKTDEQGEVTITAIIPDALVTLSVKPPRNQKLPDGSIQKSVKVALPAQLKDLKLGSGEQTNLGTVRAELIDDRK